MAIFSSDSNSSHNNSSHHVHAGPPILAIVFFVVFSVGVLAFVTLRQVHTAENHCLRLLASFSQRVEASVEDLTIRFVRIASVDEKDRVPRLLKNIQHVEALEVEESSVETPGLDHVLRDGRLYLTYAGPTLQPEKAVVEQEITQKGRGSTPPIDADSGIDPDERNGESSAPRQRRVDAVLDLRSLVTPMVPAGVFDSVLIADEAGTVFFQVGEPELVITEIDRLLPSTQDSEAPRIDGKTDHVTVYVAGRKYQLFIQPIPLNLQASRSQPPETVHWTAYSLVSADSMLSASLASSPILLLFLVSVFPLALLAWPVLKLWLISPRQRFTRIDAAFLVSSAVVGLSLLTLFFYAFYFHFDLRHLSDQQLETLSRTVESQFQAELGKIHAQLVEMEREDCWDEGLGVTSERGLEYLATLRERLRSDQTPRALPLSGYPFFHSLFWIDEEGEQRGNLPLSRYSVNTRSVENRDYFTCVRHDLGYRLTDADGETLCLQSILSNTSGLALAAAAKPLENPRPRECSEESPSPDLVGVALTTELRSITHPGLPDGIRLAIVDEHGLVHFHSNPTRNLTENLLKASNEDPALRGVLADRRTALLDVNYLGLDHRLHVRPIRDLPWSLVVLRDEQELRQRTFEMVLDFFNVFLLYAGILHLVFGCALTIALSTKSWSGGGFFEALWPDWKKHSTYEAILALVPLVLAGGAALSLFWPSSSRLWPRSTVLFLYCFFLAPLFCLSIPFSTRTLGFSTRYLGWKLEKRYPPIRPLVGKLRELSRRSRDSAKITPMEALSISAWVVILAALFFDSSERAWLAAGLSIVCGASAILCLCLRDHLSKFILTVSIFALCLAFGWIFFPPFAGSLFAISATILLLRHFLFASSFTGKQRRVRYIFALTCILITTSILPASGFAYVAIDRQLEIWVERTQVDLVRGQAERSRHHLCFDRASEDPLSRLDPQTPEICGPPWSPEELREICESPRARTERPADVARLDAPQCYRLALFDTTLREPGWGVDLSGGDISGGDASGDDASRLDGESLWSATRRDPMRAIAGVLSFRFASYDQITRQPLPVDPVRYRSEEWTWHLDDGSAMVGELQSTARDGEGAMVRSTLPSSTWIVDLEPRWISILLFLTVLVLFASPPIFAFVIAEKLTMISLVPFGQATHRMRWLLDRASAESPIYLVTTVPELAVLAIKEALEEAERPGPLEICSLRDLPGKKWEDHDENQNVGDVKGATPLLVITSFWPDLHDEHETDHQIEALTRALDRGIALLIVSRIDPRDFETLGRHAANHPPCARWASFLARFTTHYMRECRGEEADDPLLKLRESYESELEKRLLSANKEQDEQLPPRAKELLSLLARECAAPRQLRNIGDTVADELAQSVRSGARSKLVDLTAPRLLVSQVGHMARAYYHAIWTGCRTDERVVLYQLARDGLVNPKNYGVVNDLALKGLVVRDPRLRIMNHSFGRFVLNTVGRATLVQWEEEEGTSAWSIFKWLLPLPLLLLGGYLFATHPSAFANVVGLVVALGSIVPTFHNLFDYFQTVSARREVAAARKRERDTWQLTES